MTMLEVGAGPGRKQCPGCKKYVGVRTHHCECGHSFTGAPKPEVKEEIVVSTYETPGKGKKQCPKCKIYVGVRTGICVCKHNFAEGKVEREEEEVVVPTYTEGGRGKKQCPKCQVYVGARSQTCPCGHNFHEEKETPTVNIALPESRTDPRDQFKVVSEVNSLAFATIGQRVTTSGRRHYTSIPAGDPPVKLTGHDEATVTKWVEAIVNFGERQNPKDIYTAEAVRYWAAIAYTRLAGFSYDEWLKNKTAVFCVINEVVPTYGFV